MHIAHYGGNGTVQWDRGRRWNIQGKRKRRRNYCHGIRKSKGRKKSENKVEGRKRREEKTSHIIATLQCVCGSAKECNSPRCVWEMTGHERNLGQSEETMGD